ncbi:hypothetical protein QR680_013001 [Steinernema hermaphroditum]|uniref:SPIN-DOC-like zinc-finger domain-containing protein n=1 Tax=Steinernema hermaphroditum TaxID=289476 RepID=A0AA39I423_9BILA|nr:hypothetical protein QR680_013001 [Steinernema hermaphroditum]
MGDSLRVRGPRGDPLCVATVIVVVNERRHPVLCPPKWAIGAERVQMTFESVPVFVRPLALLHRRSTKDRGSADSRQDNPSKLLEYPLRRPSVCHRSHASTPSVRPNRQTPSPNPVATPASYVAHRSPAAEYGGVCGPLAPSPRRPFRGWSALFAPAGFQAALLLPARRRAAIQVLGGGVSGARSCGEHRARHCRQTRKLASREALQCLRYPSSAVAPDPVSSSLQPPKMTEKVEKATPVPTLRKRRLAEENRRFNERWIDKYCFVPSQGRFVCLLCHSQISVPKEYNMRRHYEAKHTSFDAFQGENRSLTIQSLRIVLELGALASLANASCPVTSASSSGSDPPTPPPSTTPNSTTSE